MTIMHWFKKPLLSGRLSDSDSSSGGADGDGLGRNSLNTSLEESVSERGLASENFEDLSDIVNDRDQTLSSHPEDAGDRPESPRTVSHSSEIAPEDFIHGDIDLVDQMRRSVYAMNPASRSPAGQTLYEEGFSGGHDTDASENDGDANDGGDGDGDDGGEANEYLLTRSSFNEEKLETIKGGGTGSYTDLGAGASSVTRKRANGAQNKQSHQH